ncbi:MAG TPA: GNVR domain-containing protein, partial [Bacteroidota bacterium]|nr:GNVR domain-containing protein [Bacteroidota bacterium]
RQIGEIDAKLRTYQREVAVLRSFPEAFRSEAGKQALFDISRSELPFSSELHALLTKYDEFAQRYTTKYPDVAKLETQILDLLERMRKGVDSEISKQQSQRWTLEKRRTQNIDDIKRSSISQRVDQDKESNYGIYQKLYDEMKIKLEQARTTRDLGKRAADQFIIIDPARLPIEPSKPNRALIMLGGLGLGLLMGILSAATAEMLDSRVHSPRDIENYRKPVIAFIPETLQ